MFHLWKEVATQPTAWHSTKKGARTPKGMGYGLSTTRAQLLTDQGELELGQ